MDGLPLGWHGAGDVAEAHDALKSAHGAVMGDDGSDAEEEKRAEELVRQKETTCDSVHV